MQLARRGAGGAKAAAATGDKAGERRQCAGQGQAAKEAAGNELRYNVCIVRMAEQVRSKHCSVCARAVLHAGEVCVVIPLTSELFYAGASVYCSQHLLPVLG
jgi:hypothetical protein